MTEKKNPKTTEKDYTVDHDSSGVFTMPSITLLLNRKTFTVSRSSPSTEPTKSGKVLPIPPPLTLPTSATTPAITHAGADEGTLLVESSSGQNHAASPPTPKAAVRVQTIKRQPAEKRGAQRVTLWDIKQLKCGADPLGKGLAILVERGVREALFLSITEPPAGSPVPHFLASAAIAPRNRLKLWTGLRWDPTIVPALWNLFVRTGHAELPPPGAETDIASNRNVVRAAFGTNHDEWLLLVRVGILENCRGVLCLVSDQSMLQALVLASPFLASAVNLAPAKKAS